MSRSWFERVVGGVPADDPPELAAELAALRALPRDQVELTCVRLSQMAEQIGDPETAEVVVRLARLGAAAIGKASA